MRFRLLHADLWIDPAFDALDAGARTLLAQTDSAVQRGLQTLEATVQATRRRLIVAGLNIVTYALLLYVACRKFRIPDTDAENLIQEVFLSYLQSGTRIENVRAWLVAAVCNVSTQ